MSQALLGESGVELYVMLANLDSNFYHQRQEHSYLPTLGPSKTSFIGETSFHFADMNVFLKYT